MSNADLAAQGTFVQFCNECGNKLVSSMKFCGGCGSQVGTMPTAPASTAAMQGVPIGENEALTQVDEPSFTLLQGWGYYAASCVSLGVLIWFIPSIGVLGYLAIGVFMSRFVMRRLVEWHPQYNTLNNVVSAKIWMVILWPLRMLILLVQLSVNHVL
ncbi:MAG: zinc ribbon domain-containing protein [Burkholderiaceae bacterium]|nr:zinc ribbon domain-containing protein [Burkholderiaceae bacterium]